MADNYYNPWVDAAQGMSSVGNSLSGLALGLAQQKYQQQMGQQRMALEMMQLQQQRAMNRKHGELYDAQSALARANELLAGQKQKELERTGAAKGQLGDAAWYAGMVQAGQNQGVDMGPRGDIANAQMMGAMSQLPDSARQDLPVNIAQMLQMSDPRMQQLMATGTKAAMNVPAGGTLTDVIGGEPLYQSPRTLGQGQTLVPGMGGDAIAQGFPPRQTALTDPRQRLIGSLGNIVNPYNVGGVVTNPEDPIYKAASTELLRQLQGLGTNQTAQATVNTQPQTTGLPSVTSKEQFDSLPKGAKYIGKDGKTYMKP